MDLCTEFNSILEINQKYLDHEDIINNLNERYMLLLPFKKEKKIQQKKLKNNIKEYYYYTSVYNLFQAYKYCFKKSYFNIANDILDKIKKEKEENNFWYLNSNYLDDPIIIKYSKKYIASKIKPPNNYLNYSDSNLKEF